MIVAGTGHRPPRLGLGYDSEGRRRLKEFAQEQLLKLGPMTVISGGAQGWDLALAHAAHDLRMPCLMALPFDGQDASWPADARAYYARLLNCAFKVVVVSPGGYEKNKYVTRDFWMVDACDMVLALLDDGKQNSGTRLTVEYALKKEKRVVNAWVDWTG